ncbi:site-specific integrase [Alsobacter sp. SYSU BS001988]
MLLHPDVADPIEALVISVENDKTVLAGATVRRYKAEMLAQLDQLTLEALGRALATEQHASVRLRRAAAAHRITEALAARRGKPEPRTSARKIFATKQQARILFRALAKEAIETGDLQIVLLGLLLFFVPRVACRPVEWIDAKVEGDSLVVNCAKNTNERAGFPSRSIGLENYSTKIKVAAAVLVKHLPRVLAAWKDYRGWHGAISELLARRCASLNLPRFSLYSFRHIAIGTWIKAGLAPWQIAALAGHASLKTARKHYGTRGAWDPDEPLATPDPDRAAALRDRALDQRNAVQKAAQEEAWDFDCPRPANAEQSTCPTPNNAAWENYKAALLAKADALVSGHKLVRSPAPNLGSASDPSTINP